MILILYEFCCQIELPILILYSVLILTLLFCYMRTLILLHVYLKLCGSEIMMQTPLWGKHTNTEGHEGESSWIMLYQSLSEGRLFIFSKSPLSLDSSFVT